MKDSKLFDRIYQGLLLSFLTSTVVFGAAWLYVLLDSFRSREPIVLGPASHGHKGPTIPKAKRSPKFTTVHDTTLLDPYHWLKDRENPEVIAYLNEENVYTGSIMSATKELQKQLFLEMASKLQPSDRAIPYRKGGYFYYTKIEPGKESFIYCRRKGSMKGREEVILDINTLLPEYSISLGAFAVSPDGKILAYSIDKNGSESYELFFKNLQTHKTQTTTILNTGTNVAWTNDSKYIYFLRQDKNYRPYQLYRYKLGNDPKSAELIYEEKDERFFMELRKSLSDRFIFVTMQSAVTTEVRFIKASDSSGMLNIVYPREQNLQYFVHHQEDNFIIRTNENAKNFKVVAVPIEDHEKAEPETIIPHFEEETIDSIITLKHHVVCFELRKGFKRIRVVDTTSGEDHIVKLPGHIYSVWPGNNKVYAAKQIQIIYSSYTLPTSYYSYNLATRELRLQKKQQVPGGYDNKRYGSYRMTATASDKYKVPITLYHHKSLKLDGSNPTILYGYGSYGITIEPYFDPTILPLIDRGFIFATAHPRGSGLLGSNWHDTGKLFNKKNTFSDFIAAAEYLCDNGYTNPNKLIIDGASAGGLLVGAVTNMRPELFHIAIAEVPFVDILNTMLDPNLPLTITEYEEWGNPNDKSTFEYIKSYSPYDNVKAQVYPHMLITAGLHDSRVQFWEPAKWVAKLRNMNRGSSNILLKTDMHHGHAGRFGRYENLKNSVFKYAFIILHLNKSKTDKPAKSNAPVRPHG